MKERSSYSAAFSCVQGFFTPSLQRNCHTHTRQTSVCPSFYLLRGATDKVKNKNTLANTLKTKHPESQSFTHTIENVNQTYFS